MFMWKDIVFCILLLVVTRLLEVIITDIRFRDKATELKIKYYLIKAKSKNNIEQDIIDIMVGSNKRLAKRDIDISFFQIPKGKEYRKKYNGTADGAVVKVYIRIGSVKVYEIVLRYDTREVFYELDRYCIELRNKRDIKGDRRARNRKGVIITFIRACIIGVMYVGFLFKFVL